ncbi:hypothetical protein K443DRAFT_399193 [Laccaria amethystina LaAM-08-1]|uniref:Uncharacterized protein n=1 Tax=Laccaria amethystina LaAM-08-1 TaxID=1095629 RepID=A0A0C9Y3Z2_9AGAR|nr:hypothetical protein K443DRAFT_399193 [Laccaria amethystina LaAM-08-1]
MVTQNRSGVWKKCLKIWEPGQVKRENEIVLSGHEMWLSKQSISFSGESVYLKVSPLDGGLLADINAVSLLDVENEGVTNFSNTVICGADI